MPYIGRGLTTGAQYQKLDDIAINNATTFTMSVGSANVSPDQNHLILVVNGVIQEPGTGFTVAGSTCTLASAITTSGHSGLDTIYGVIAGDAAFAAYDSIGANALGVTAGTAAASKAVVLDGSKNIATLGTIGSGAITATGSSSFATSIKTPLIEYTDGDNAITIADGGGITAAAGITSTAASNSFGATAFSGAVTTNSTIDGIDIATRDAILTSTTTTAGAALPKAGGTMTGNIVMGDDTSIGIADDAERIEFDGAGDISVLGANFGIGASPDSASRLLVDHDQNAYTRILVKNTSTGSAAQSVTHYETSAGSFTCGAVSDEHSLDGAALLWHVPNKNMVFATNNTLALTIDSSQDATFAGNILVPNGADISCGDSGSGQLDIFGGGTNKGGYIRLRGGGNSGDITMYTGTSGDGAVALTIASSGHTMIGNQTMTDHTNQTLGLRGTSNSGVSAITFLTTSSPTAGRSFAWASNYTAHGAFDLRCSENRDGTPFHTKLLSFGGNGDVDLNTQVYGNNIGGDTFRNLNIRNDGRLGVDTSSKRYKKNIKDISDISWIYDLRPVDFEWKETNKKDWGLIAEEVLEVNPRIVGIENEVPEWVDYKKLIPILLKAVQELSAKVEALENA